MELIKELYNKSTIQFILEGEEVMVNATEMAAIFGKRITNYLANKETQDFIKNLEEDLKEYTYSKSGIPVLLPLKSTKKSSSKSEIPDLQVAENGVQLIKTVRGTGTWMHRYLAIHFAMWLDVRFHLWVIRTLDRVILGTFKAIKDATTEKIRAKEAYQNKRAELLKTSAEFSALAKLEEQMHKAGAKRAKLLKDSNYIQTELPFNN